jgi:hypothetical protein
MSPRRRFWVVILVIGAAGLLVYIMARSLPIRLLDLDNYLSATRMIARRQNPYTRVEFFAPPWLALLLLPLAWLPPKIAASIWLITGLGCVAASVLLACRWLERCAGIRRLALSAIIPTLMPGALFSYITGQITPLVSAAALVAAWQISAGTGVWIPALALLLTTLKPHIVALPILICGLEMVRTKQWRSLLVASAGLAILAGLATVWQPDWIPSLIKAWSSQGYKGGAPGLISPGYRGLRELGIPGWAFLPGVAYTLCRWWRDGLQPHVLALALPVNLLLIPYSRSYDFVVLVLPMLYVASLERRLDYWILGVAILGVFVLPFTGLAVISPVVLLIAVLLKEASRPVLAAAAPTIRVEPG